jgi:hypothetical protein
MNIHESLLIGSGTRGIARAILACLFLLLAPLTSFGGGGNVSSAPPPTTPGAVSSPGEEVTSLPAALVQDSSGLTFLGSWREIRSIVLSVRGQGRVDVVRLSPTSLAVTLVGDFQVELDRARLASSGVAILFRGGLRYHDGVAQLQIAGSRPVLLSPDRVPLPLPRLAAIPRMLGSVLTLEVFGPLAQRAHVAADFGPERITLVQRTF